MSSVPHPFYYPTSIAIIDDNTDFLVNFSLQLNEKLAFTLHPSPVEGLKFINSAPTSNALTQKFIKSHTDVIDDEYVDNVLVVTGSASTAQ